MKIWTGIAAVACVALPLMAPSVASAQVRVTEQAQNRADANAYFERNEPAIGLTRKADFFVKPLYVSSDSRDATVRRNEVTTMLRETMAAAKAQNISLVAGDYTLEALTDETLKDLTFGRGSRPDTTRVTIYARLPVGGAIDSTERADEKIDPFVKAIPATGRSYIDTGRTDLAITDPDQYRLDVVKTIANEARSYSAQFGSDYGVQIRGLDSDLFWKQAGETEVFLYIKHNFVIQPK